MDGMLANVVLASILAGVPSLVLSVSAGHHPLMSLIAYMLSGTCGVLAVSLRMMRLSPGRG